LDLKLHFWFLSREVNPSKQNKPTLSSEMKQFFAVYLSEKVEQLTKIPCLSKYFAVSYIQQPQTNSIFQESFSREWELDMHQKLELCFESESKEEKNKNLTKLETFVLNFSKHQVINEISRQKTYSSGEIKFTSKLDKPFTYKSSENKKMLDMLSRRESLSIGRGELSEWQGSSISEVIEIRRKMYEYKLMLQQKEHKMRMKEWEGRETLAKSHEKWIFFVR
jgi:hypothetical protein